MSSLKYTVVKTKEQYFEYCRILEDIVFQENEQLDDEIELLTLLIEKRRTLLISLNCPREQFPKY